jgi:hypothetical protein
LDLACPARACHLQVRTVSLDSVKGNGAVLLGAIVALSSVGGAFILLGNGAENITTFVTATIGPTVIGLFTLYKSAQNGTKADEAKVASTEAKETAAVVANKADAIHSLVNGGLEARIASVVNQVLPGVMRDVLLGNETTPPLLSPAAIAAPTQKENT